MLLDYTKLTYILITFSLLFFALAFAVMRKRGQLMTGFHQRKPKDEKKIRRLFKASLNLAGVLTLLAASLLRLHLFVFMIWIGALAVNFIYLFIQLSKKEYWR